MASFIKSLPLRVVFAIVSFVVAAIAADPNSRWPMDFAGLFFHTPLSLGAYLCCLVLVASSFGEVMRSIIQLPSIDFDAETFPPVDAGAAKLKPLQFELPFMHNGYHEFFSFELTTNDA